MAAITHVFTISRVAEMLGEDWLDEICIELDPEDGRGISMKTERRPSRASASTISPRSSNAIKRIPIYFRDRWSEPAAALTGC
jgi:hypothetical protein